MSMQVEVYHLCKSLSLCFMLEIFCDGEVFQLFGDPTRRETAIHIKPATLRIDYVH